jgi:hypothetical protein
MFGKKRLRLREAIGTNRNARQITKRNAADAAIIRKDKVEQRRGERPQGG